MNSPMIGEFPAQMVSNAENVSISWRHHRIRSLAQLWLAMICLLNWSGPLTQQRWLMVIWASYQIHKIAGCPCAGNAGNVFPPPRVNDPDMHHGTCVTHVSWCVSGSLTSGFLWSRWRRKRSRYSRRMRNPPFCVSGKRLMQERLSYAP